MSKQPTNAERELASRQYDGFSAREAGMGYGPTRTPNADEAQRDSAMMMPMAESTGKTASPPPDSVAAHVKIENTQATPLANYTMKGD